MKTPAVVFFLAGAWLFAAGCSKSAESLAAKNARLFSTTDAQTKAQWEQANAALKTNGYAEATLALRNLQQRKLSPEQLQGVNETVTAVSDQMYAAANKGDAGALRAIEVLRTNRSR